MTVKFGKQTVKPSRGNYHFMQRLWFESSLCPFVAKTIPARRKSSLTPFPHPRNLPIVTEHEHLEPNEPTRFKAVMWVIAPVLTGAMACLIVLYADHAPLTLWWGTLSSTRDQYLDGSGRTFQETSWHLGNATRTWGETYGMKINRFYASLSVTHINHSVTPEQANE